MASICSSYLSIMGCENEATEKVEKVYSSTKKVAVEAYSDTKEYANDTYHDAKIKYKDYNKDKAKEKKEELETCIFKLEESLPKYGLFLEKNYMDISQNNELKILNSYSRLSNIKKLSTQNKIDNQLMVKLYSSESTLEYIAIILKELKKIEKDLKENNPLRLNELVTRTEFLMYAWTTPMELFSSKRIYESSLLGLSKKLYKHIKKDSYRKYTEFIYSMLNINLINQNIMVKKDTSLDAIPKFYFSKKISGETVAPTIQDKKALESICLEVLDSILDKTPNEYLFTNIVSTLDIDKEKLEKGITEISKNNYLFESPIFFERNFKNLNLINIIDNPLNDSWYLVIREYMELQDSFYKMKAELEKITKILEILPNTEKKVALLKQNSFDIDALYRKFDEMVRYNIIDLPISIYADIYFIEFKKGKKWYNDDEKAMGNIAIAYNKACANMQKYMVSEFAINKVMKITKALKKEFSDDEWKEVKTRAKLTQDWFNMLNKVKINNK